MNVSVREYREADLPELRRIWNRVIEDAEAFPEEEPLSEEGARRFFAAQTYAAVAVDDESGRVLGCYDLHPNNVGRVGHVCNSSFAVDADARGRHVGEALVRDCLAQAKAHGFRILQFNAVVAGNAAARGLYRKLGFVELGSIPGGFRHRDGSYEDIVLYYHTL